MIVQPHLLVKWLRVEGLDLVKWYSDVVLTISKHDISFNFFFIQQHIRISTGPCATPLITLIITTVTLWFHTWMREHHDSGVIELDPVVILFSDRPVMSHLSPSRVDDNGLEFVLVVAGVTAVEA